MKIERLARLSTVCFIALCQHNLHAQQQNEDFTERYKETKLYNKKREADIIEGVAFDRMVSQDVTYAITGEKVPTSGIKVDLTKATSTLTGFVVTKKGPDILLDLGVGVTEGTAALFDSEKKIHSDFSAAVNFVFTPKLSWAKMHPVAADMTRTTWPAHKTSLYSSKSDSLLCVIMIIKGHRLKVESESGTLYEFNPEIYLREQFSSYRKKDEEDTNAFKYIEDVIKFEGTLRADGFTEEDTARLSSSQQQLLRDLTKRYFSDALKTNKLVAMYKGLSMVKGRSDLMLSDLIATMNEIFGAIDENINYQINFSEKFWSVKSLIWITAGPFVRRQGFSIFDQTALERNDTSSITAGFSGRFNQLIEWRSGLFYWKAGADLFRANNLTDFTKVEYVEQDSIATNGGKRMYSEKKGITYTGAVLDHGFGFTFSLETYLFLSRKNFIPGLYFRYDRTHSEALKNNVTAVFEFGLPFNINSPDKSKSIVSIAPYMRFPELAEDDNEEGQDNKDKFQIGLRIGLPVQIASKAKK